MKKKEIVGLHLLFWFLVINLTFVANLPRVLSDFSQEFAHFALQSFWNLVVMAIVFYAAYFSFGYFTRKPRRFAWIAVLYLVIFLIVFIGNLQLARAQWFFQLSIAIVITSVLLSIIVFGFILRMGIQGIQDRRIRRQLEKEKLQTQLELLKSQINPHFLFNTLNNIDILIKEDPGRASLFLNKLSDILRYSLYETRQETVPLEAEIENINKYIELQKIRTQNPTFARFSVEGDVSGLSIPPMTFLPFIENAFKHSTNKKIENAIVIKMVADQQTISFHCRNHCADVFQPDENNGGLGMHLICDRLNLLFGDNYSLENGRNGDWYEVILNIQLDDH